MFRSAIFLATLLSTVASFAAPNLSITASPYLTGGLFTAPVLPQEGQEVTITVRAEATEPVAEALLAIVDIHRVQGRALVSKTLALQPIPAPAGLPQAAGEAKATYHQAQFTWTTERNGLYTVRVGLDPANAIKEADEDDNAAELLLPVIVAGKGRALHFPWYREDPTARWTTCVTSANDVGQRARLAERGVTALHWAPATINYNKDEAKTNPEAVLAQIEQALFERYTSAVSNIGSIDSERVDVEFFVDGKSVGRRATASVPAGPSCYDTMAQLTLPVAPKPGSHTCKARIVYAPNVTVLDTSLKIERFVH